MPRRAAGIRPNPSRRCGCKHCLEREPLPIRRPTQSHTGTWQYRYYDDAGVRQVGTSATYTEAEERLTQAKAKVSQGTWRDPKRGKIQLATWYTEHYRQTRESTEAATRASDAAQWRAHVEPAWGRTTLRTLERSHADIQTWVVQMERAGLGESAVRKAANLLDRLLAFAVRDHRIESNACDGLLIRADRHIPAADGRSPTVAEVDRLCDRIAIAVYRQMPRFAIETGLRWGEAAALPPEEIDRTRREIRVRWVLEEIEGRKSLRAYPKADASYRTVPLTAAADALLALQYAMQEPIYRKDEDEDPHPVFRGARGALLSRGNYESRILLPAARLAGVYQSVRRESGRVEHWPTFHDFRATFADRLDRGGVPRGLLKAVLGHKTKSSRDVTETYLRGRQDERRLILLALGDQSEGQAPAPARLRLVAPERAAG